MARPLRLDEPGLTRHITNRGNERKKIFRNDADCTKFLELLAETVRRFGWGLRGRQARIETESEHQTAISGDRTCDDPCERSDCSILT
jgi:hypothetical protein